MYKLIAILLLTIFVASTSVKLYKDFTGKDTVAVSLLDGEDDSEENELEKENDIKKDKLTPIHFAFALSTLIIPENFYLKYFQRLSNPFLAKPIIPPNVA